MKKKKYIDALRLKEEIQEHMYQETKHMTLKEREEYYRKRAEKRRVNEIKNQNESEKG